LQRIADYIVEVNKAEGVTPEVLDSSLDVRTFGIWIWVLGGAVADVAPEDTAFFNRKSWCVDRRVTDYHVLLLLLRWPAAAHQYSLCLSSSNLHLL
jgi:hypothetical protein